MSSTLKAPSLSSGTTFCSRSDQTLEASSKVEAGPSSKRMTTQVMTIVRVDRTAITIRIKMKRKGRAMMILMTPVGATLTTLMMVRAPQSRPTVRMRVKTGMRWRGRQSNERTENV